MRILAPNSGLTRNERAQEMTRRTVNILLGLLYQNDILEDLTLPPTIDRLINEIHLVDIQTGSFLKIFASGHTSYSWMHGNWSCDCNRADYFGSNPGNTEYCLGCHRFIAVWNDSEIGIEEMNRGYSKDTIEKAVQIYKEKFQESKEGE